MGSNGLAYGAFYSRGTFTVTSGSQINYVASNRLAPPQQPQQQPDGVIPEPLSATLALMGLSMLGLATQRRRRADR